MTALQSKIVPATVHEIREIIGPCDDEVLTSIVDIGATREEVLEAFTWLSSDDYLQRNLHHGLSGPPARVFKILEAKFPDNNRR